MRKNIVFSSLLLLNTSFCFAQKAQEGNASYYSDNLSGKPTTTGEMYKPEEKTAAHASLPYGTKVKVTNLDNNKVVYVRINDRIRSDNNKIAILSKAAAEEIGLVYSGKAKIKIEASQGIAETSNFTTHTENKETAEASNKNTISVESIMAVKTVLAETTNIEGFSVNHFYDVEGNMLNVKGYGLQLGSFTKLQAARDFCRKFGQVQGSDTRNVFIQISKSEDKPMLYRVVYGMFDGETETREKQKQLASTGVKSVLRPLELK